MNETAAAFLAILGARALTPTVDWLRRRSRTIDAWPLLGAVLVGIAFGLAAWGLALAAGVAGRADLLVYLLGGLSASGIGGAARQGTSRAADAGGFAGLLSGSLRRSRSTR